MRIQIKVIPGSKKEGVSTGEILTVRVKSPAREGKANRDVIRLLQKHFNSPVRIISGHTSRKKIVEIEGFSR